MKYLAIFQLDDFKSATGFTSKAKAAEFIESCAKAGKGKALKNSETGSYLIELGKENPTSITVNIEPVDTNVKFELTYNKDGQILETSSFDTRKAVVDRAHQILDELGYDAAKDEDAMGHWQIANAEQNLAADIQARLILVGSSENIVERYGAADMKYFCQHFETESTKLTVASEVATVVSLKDARRKGLTNLSVGLAIAAVGGIISLISYNTAKPGERYTIYTGIIAIGVIDALCGLYYLINPKAALPKDKRKKR